MNIEFDMYFYTFTQARQNNLFSGMMSTNDIFTVLSMKKITLGT